MVIIIINASIISFFNFLFSTYLKVFEKLKFLTPNVHTYLLRSGSNKW